MKSAREECIYWKYYITLEGMETPEKIILELKMKDTYVLNHYPLWVYPKEVDHSIPEAIKICRSMKEAKEYLDNGRKVLLIPDTDKDIKALEGFFTPDFWCFPMFRAICENTGKPVAPGTLGILCDHEHPALKEFPCDYHSDWQWWSILMNSHPVVLDEALVVMNPIVQVIDNIERNHRLGLLYEVEYGKRKLMVCACDLFLLQDKPEARQLLHSILNYIASSG